MERLGLIAGNGIFPLVFSEEASRLGIRVTAIAHEEETDPGLEKVVDRIYWVKVGQLGKMIGLLQEEMIRDVVLLGGIKKTRLFSGVRPDLRGTALLLRVRNNKDDAVLRAVAGELEKEGIAVRSVTDLLPSLVVEEGVLTRRRPSSREREDIETGILTAKEIGRQDIGQCVVVKDHVVTAVEAVDGTDETIRRGGRLAREGAVVVKVSKPSQDLRFDLPAVGPGTIAVMAEVRATALALEAGRTLLLNRPATLEAADRAEIAIVGVPPGRAVRQGDD